MDRKRKLRIIQICLLLLGSLIISYTYVDFDKNKESKIIPKDKQEILKKQLDSKNESSQDIFYNIEYTGLDLSGNRYILKAKEAFNNKSNIEIVNMNEVEAIFYFKDDTELYVWSDSGVYNNKTLDMSFKKNVRAVYEGSELFSQKADYSNSESFLIISEKVKIKDFRGTILADKLLFDIKKQKLNIASFNDGKINANVELK